MSPHAFVGVSSPLLRPASRSCASAAASRAGSDGRRAVRRASASSIVSPKTSSSSPMVNSGAPGPPAPPPAASGLVAPAATAAAAAAAESTDEALELRRASRIFSSTFAAASRASAAAASAAFSAFSAMSLPNADKRPPKRDMLARIFAATSPSGALPRGGLLAACELGDVPSDKALSPTTCENHCCALVERARVSPASLPLSLPAAAAASGRLPNVRENPPVLLRRTSLAEEGSGVRSGAALPARLRFMDANMPLIDSLMARALSAADSSALSARGGDDDGVRVRLSTTAPSVTGVAGAPTPPPRRRVISRCRRCGHFSRS
mmetsp:Transcript_17028/g.59659  ORF Transcript_17028/g.59659 Transcript_17028/m.59659 type:complete len:322 (-) Transcript_17028:2663-3628(-)